MSSKTLSSPRYNPRLEIASNRASTNLEIVQSCLDCKLYFHPKFYSLFRLLMTYGTLIKSRLVDSKYQCVNYSIKFLYLQNGCT